MVFELPSRHDTRKVGCDLLKHCKPFTNNARLNRKHARDVGSGSRHTYDKASADRIGYVNEHDRDFICFSLERGDDRGVCATITSGCRAIQFFSKRLEIGPVYPRRSDSPPGYYGHPSIQSFEPLCETG